MNNNRRPGTHLQRSHAALPCHARQGRAILHHHHSFVCNRDTGFESKWEVWFNQGGIAIHFGHITADELKQFVGALFESHLFTRAMISLRRTMRRLKSEV